MVPIIAMHHIIYAYCKVHCYGKYTHTLMHLHQPHCYRTWQRKLIAFAMYREQECVPRPHDEDVEVLGGPLVEKLIMKAL